MKESGRRRGWITARVIAASLIACASVFSVCGSAVWRAPPRFDGAGYAVLALALERGQGYRAIDHPDRPLHAHFPPGYPLLLAVTWWITGLSAAAAHVVSCLCTLGATLAAWRWFHRIMGRRAALVLGLALACNWLWARTGSAIQSEPLYMLLGQLAILAAVAARGRPAAGPGSIIMVGTLLAACFLTRHVAIGLALAILLDLALRGRWRQALAIAAVALVVVLPWLVWMAVVGSTGQSQTHAGLLLQGYPTAAQGGARLLVFYAQRIPDQITGPFVEVGTVFQSSPVVAILANLWAALASGVIVAGWARTLGRPRRRLAGLVPLVTLVVLFFWPYTEAGRFLIPLIPCLFIGAVEGLTGLAIWLAPSNSTRVRPSRLRLQAATLVLAASLPYSAYMLVTGRARAQEANHRDFDAACEWIAEHGDRPGPVLSRHPGEVFWRTGRPGLEVSSAERPGAVDADPDAIARTIDAYGAAYLLIDQERYARAPRSPLARFIAERPDRARKVWGRETERGSVAIYELHPDRGPR